MGGDNSLAGGLTSALTLMIFNWLLTKLLNRFPVLENQVVGEPVVLVTDGKARKEVMQRQGVTDQELMASLREHGVGSLNKVSLAVLEVDGTISIVPKDSPIHRTRRRFRGQEGT